MKPEKMGGGGEQECTDMYIEQKSLECNGKNSNSTKKSESVQQEPVTV